MNIGFLVPRHDRSNRLIDVVDDVLLIGRGVKISRNSLQCSNAVPAHDTRHVHLQSVLHGALHAGSVELLCGRAGHVGAGTVVVEIEDFLVRDGNTLLLLR